MRIVSKILATLVFGLIVALASSPLAATFVSSGYSNRILVAILIVVALIVLTAPTGRRAWGRGSLLAGVTFIALPLTMGALSTVSANAVISAASADSQGAAAVGATIGAGLMVGASAVIGSIFGTIFIILGIVLVLGGRREVIVVNARIEPGVK